MSHRKLSLIFGGDYDRTRLLCDPEIAERHNLDVEIELMPKPHDVFHALSHSDRADGGEFSLSFFTSLASQRHVQRDLVALPIPISRFFRHGNVLVNKDAGISDPADLKNKTFGVPEYGSTMVVWMRGMLADEYGVQPSDIHWRAGRSPVALGPGAVRYPDDVDIQQAEGDLMEMLSAGDIDAYIGLVPKVLPPNVVRLFPDYGAVERDYFRRTGIFPIMHLLVLRREFYERDPEVATALFNACVDAKAQALSLLKNTGVLGVSLPWLLSAVDEQTAAMGGDLWPYGLGANRQTIEKFIEYSSDQGLLWEHVTPEDLFLALDPP